MAVRVVNSCSIFFCACSPPPLAPSRCLRFHFRHINHNLGFPSLRTRSDVFSLSIRRCSFNSLLESVMEELKALRARRRIRASSRWELIFFEVLFFFWKEFDFDFFNGSLIGSLFYVAELVAFLFFIFFNRLEEFILVLVFASFSCDVLLWWCVSRVFFFWLCGLLVWEGKWVNDRWI